MSAAATWGPATAGPLGIDWPSALRPETRFDPYLVWRDFTAGLENLPVVLELQRGFDEPALQAINHLGVLVTPHYIDWHMANGAAPRHVTAVCLTRASLRKLFEAVAAGKHVVERYELSAGLANPDYDVEGPVRQLWKPAPRISPLPSSNLVGVIDYGCAFAHKHFDSDESGTRRVQVLWNQEAELGKSAGRQPLAWQVLTRFAQGWWVTNTQLAPFIKHYRQRTALDELSCYRDAQYEPIRRSVTHGTFVMDVATGYPSPVRGHAPPGPRHQAPIVFVQLPRHLHGQQIAGLLRAQVLDAAQFVALHLAAGFRAVINLSYGGYCGPHDGSSIVERALDELIASFDGRLALVVPSGNALDQDIHAQLYLRSGQTDAISWENVPDDPSDSFVELWWPQGVAARARIVAPDGSASDWAGPGTAAVLRRKGRVAALLCITGRPCQSKTGSMALFAVAPTASGAAPYGRWRIEVENTAANAALVDAWCERDDPVFGNEAGPRQSRFVDQIEKTGTLNALAHGRRTIVVGGYVVHDTGSEVVSGPVAAMSGTGPGRGQSGRDRHPAENGASRMGPEILAIADSGLEDGIAAAAVLDGDDVRLAGTSVAAAHYTRAYIDAGFERPDAFLRDTPSGLVPGREPHPDDALDIPRVA